jgi:hypothetical protein
VARFFAIFFIRFSVLSHKAKQKTASYAGVVLKAYRKRYQTMI